MTAPAPSPLAREPLDLAAIIAEWKDPDAGYIGVLPSGHRAVHFNELAAALTAHSEAVAALVEAARKYQESVEGPLFSDDEYIAAGDALRARLAALEDGASPETEENQQ